MSANSLDYDPARLQHEVELSPRTHQAVIGSIERLAVSPLASPLLLDETQVPWYDDTPEGIDDGAVLGDVYSVPNLGEGESIHIARYNDTGRSLAKQAAETAGTVGEPLGHISFSYEKPDARFSGSLTILAKEIAVLSQCYEEPTLLHQENEPLKEFASKVGLRRVVISYEAKQQGGNVVDFHGFCSDVEGRDIHAALENYS